MKFLDFFLSLAALVSLLVATYLFATDHGLNESVDSMAANRVSIFNSDSDSQVSLGGEDGSETSQHQASTPESRWKSIIIHHSGTKSGNAKIFDRYHRKVKKFPGGIAYHFVIGNGTKSSNGAVEITHRWHKKIAGVHCSSAEMNRQSVGICLVGDFNKTKPTQAQMRALAELIREIRKDYDIPLASVIGHKDVKSESTDCPGKNFSVSSLKPSLR